MFLTQKKYLTYIKEVEKNIQEASIPHETKKKLFNPNLENSLKEAQLLIPVVGSFSAGKTTLLNSFLGKKYLPEGITPETAIATELHYGESNSITAVSSDGLINKFDFSDMEKVKDNSQNYKLLKVYLNNESLKNIEPLILVDMPGFDSPLDLHNKAIIEYINKGVHYIVLINAEDGSIQKSIIRQISDIQAFGRDFTFFLSKANLRSDNDLKEIISNVEEQIEDNFDISKKITSLDKDGGKNLTKVLETIDPEILFENLFLEDLKNYYFDTIETLNTYVTALKKSQNENQDAIETLKEGMQRLVNKRDSMIQEVQQKYSDQSINSIVESVGKDLSNSVDELTSAAINGGEGSLSSAMTEIIRSSLIENINLSIQDISTDIVKSFSNSLTDINVAISSFSINEDWLNKITDTTSNMLQKAQSGLNSYSEKIMSEQGSNAIYKALTTVLAVTTTIIAPIFELILIFLPELIGGLFSGIQEKKKKEKIKESILTGSIPSIKRKLRTEVPKIFDEQVKDLIKNIGDKFSQELDKKSSEITAMEKEKQTDIDAVNKNIAEYEQLREKITELANNTLFK